MEDKIILDIRNYRSSAEGWGAVALRAISDGEQKAARTAARQASQYARVALELEHGGRWFESEKIKRHNAIEEAKPATD